MTKILVAGIGNIFLSDDGFGVEVVRRLAGKDVPDGVKVADFGIRGIHLAYELLEGYEKLILVDALSRGDPPGTIYTLEPDDVAASGAIPDAHGMEPMAVFAYLASIGGSPVPTVILGCEPETLDEDIGLSPTVERAVDQAVSVALELIHDAVKASTTNSPATAGQ